MIKVLVELTSFHHLCFQIETFLGVSHYLVRDLFVWQEGHLCLKPGEQVICGKKSTKGQIKAFVDEKTKIKLRRHFAPYNEKLRVEFGIDFNWPKGRYNPETLCEVKHWSDCTPDLLG